MKRLAEELEHLAGQLNRMAIVSLSEISEAIDELFGERIGKEQRRVLAKRYDRRVGAAPLLSEARTGAIYAPSIVAAPERLREVPRHNFHSMIIGGEDDE